MISARLVMSPHQCALIFQLFQQFHHRILGPRFVEPDRAFVLLVGGVIRNLAIVDVVPAGEEGSRQLQLRPGERREWRYSGDQET